jgi:PCFT/HCP family folate transporter-like MFS transporter 1/3
MVSGEFAIAYLGARLRFQWNEVDYSIFSTFLSILNILGKNSYSLLIEEKHKDINIMYFNYYIWIGVGIAVGILSHLFKMDDALIGVIACLSKVLSGLVFAFAPSKLYFYMGKHVIYFWS